MARSSFWEPSENFNINKIEDACIRKIIEKYGKFGTSIREAKKLLKLYGGRAWIEHYERDGTMFEVTPIELSGNNSTHKYNRHL